MGRSIFALLLREARVRHGRSRFGYAWALVEPILIVAFITVAMSGLLGRRQISFDFAIFYALGVVVFQYFRHCTGFIGRSVEANTALLNYPTVNEIDAVLARLVLDTATYIVIALAIYAFLAIGFGADLPAHPERLLLAYFGLSLLALGTGLNLAAFLRRYEMTMEVWGLASTPLFFMSAVIFSITNLPTDYAQLLLWNPVVHGVEGFRSGYYPDYGTTFVSFPYLYGIGLILVALGLFQLFLTRRGTR